MDRMFYVAMNGAKHVALQQATTAHNLANLQTNAYQADVPSFRALPVIGGGMPTRTYVVDNTMGYDTKSGSLINTGNARDFALASEGFFAVQLQDGSEAYTRNGGYTLNNDGMMRTHTGLLIIGDGGPISIPANAHVELKPDGSVMATLVTGATRVAQLVGQIKMVNPGPRAVYKGEDGLFRLNSGGVADADPKVTLVPEMLEASNVNAVEALVQMISHARHYDLSMNMMKTADHSDQKASSLLLVD